MHPNLQTVQALDQLDALLAESTARPLVLFKHSRTCGISAEALDALLSHLDRARYDARYAIVIVQTHRDVSNAIASRLGVRHETPQALLVSNRRVVWSASHFRVTADAFDLALRSMGRPLSAQ